MSNKLSTKMRVKIASVVVYLAVAAPIFFYLMWKVLHAVEATPVMWLLFWVYVPVSILASVVLKLVVGED